MNMSNDSTKRIAELQREAQMHKDMGNKFAMFACLRQIELLTGGSNE